MKRYLSSPEKRPYKDKKYPKRQKYEEREELIRHSFESAVLYVRNLPLNAIEPNVHDALSKYGPISYILCISSKGQAFVEFESIDSARALIEKAKKSVIKIAGEVVIFEYSKSQYIRRSGLETSTPNNVLVFTIFDVQYPMTADVLHQITSPHGTVMRIAMIKGKNEYEAQALVEFENIQHAQRAKHALNGLFIYKGCCYLKIEYAKVKNIQKPINFKVERVNITKNTVDRRDYTINQNNREPLLHPPHHQQPY